MVRLLRFNPKAGTSKKEGAKVDIYVSKGTSGFKIKDYNRSKLSGSYQRTQIITVFQSDKIDIEWITGTNYDGVYH